MKILHLNAICTLQSRWNFFPFLIWQSPNSNLNFFQIILVANNLIPDWSNCVLTKARPKASWLKKRCQMLLHFVLLINNIKSTLNKSDVDQQFCYPNLWYTSSIFLIFQHILFPFRQRTATLSWSHQNKLIWH